ncbi:cyclic nucleotide-binding domain-containing protein [Reichenbachiella sp. MALMAid0571]|uniref:cyclic nucleotide-binding domain-containing protein n=1 Tax=Reichenbachiella sp. MALMAid0571 TaxID=3143939 RepID=UPI0032E00B30
MANKREMEKLSPVINEILSRATTVTFRQGEVLYEQYARPSYLHIILEGTVSFCYNIASMEQEIMIGKASLPYTPIGINIFSIPFRNEYTVKVISEEATFLRLDKKQITEIIESGFHYSLEFFDFINKKAHKLIGEATELFADTPIISTSFDLDRNIAEGYKSVNELDQLETVLFLLQSPFMEVFEESELIELTESIERKQYKIGDVIGLQNQPASGINILESGEVEFSRVNHKNHESYRVAFRSISTPGYLLGSSSILNEPSLLTSKVSKDAVILHIPAEALTGLGKKKPDFALKLQKRILWLINNQLRAVRARLIAAQFDEEVMVATSLIESNNTKLSIHSVLHKVPHLLRDKLTIKDGIEILHHTEINGTGIEKNLASLCLDNLHHTQKEAQFYDGLKNIYNTVANASPNNNSEKIQYECILSTKKAFAPASVIIKGYENLPDKSGHIFIYNHLLNDPYYTLPNQFQITLDSHFLNSLIFEKYGDTGQRIVRVGRNIEYAHQEYYERLGFIDVYTKESDKLIESSEEKTERRKLLFENLENQLQQGKNIMISPEGTSYPTEQSPGIFKSAIFKMAVKMKTEPLIVPIVMVNFDKRIRNNKFTCQIKKPFLLSSQMKKNGYSDVKSFLINYQSEYKNYIRELIETTPK